MSRLRVADRIRFIALSLMVCCLLLLSGSSCAPPQEKPPELTGKIVVIEQKEVASKETGEVSIVIQRLDEVAERSVVDKGADTLLSVQKVVSPGSSFSSYDVGKDDRIVASVFNQEGRNGSDIWVFSGGKTRISNSNYFNDFPSFSADSEKIYFSSTRNKATGGMYDQNCYIWRMVASGAGGITRIGTPVFAYAGAQESPDAQRLLFDAREFFENSSFVWFSTPNGSLPTMLTQGRDPRWMDNEKIIFSTVDENSGLEAIWTLNIVGSELTQIISDPELDCLSPEASPNGKHIAYVKQTPGEENRSTRDVFVYTIETGLSQQITTNSSRDDMPQWSETGDALFFRSTRGLSWNIWKVSTTFLE